MAWWLGTAQALVAMKSQWHGTLIMIGQPPRKSAKARGHARRRPSDPFPQARLCLCRPCRPGAAGDIEVKQGVATSTSDSVRVIFHGQGAHGSMPDKSIDPIVMGARFVSDVQTVISRQKDPQKFGVVTVGYFQAGTVSNIIPDTAELGLSLRSFDPDTRKLLNDGVDITAKAVAEMSRAPAPEVIRRHGLPSVVNDDALAASTYAVCPRRAFGAVRLEPAYKPGWTASEDYSEFVLAGIPNRCSFPSAAAIRPCWKSSRPKESRCRSTTRPSLRLWPGRRSAPGFRR
jgi:hippurate hydrolase